jgi:hypothetical protein
MASRTTVTAPESLRCGNAHDIPEPRLPDFQPAVADAQRRHRRQASISVPPRASRFVVARFRLTHNMLCSAFEISRLLRIHSGKLLALKVVANHDELLSDCRGDGTGVSCQRTSTEI